MEKSEINSIYKQLDTFIRKFYCNECIKGLIIFFLLVAFYAIIVSTAEYFAFFPIQVRSVMFYISIILAFSVCIYYIILPLFRLLKIGKTLSYIEAAQIITKFFPEIKDTLLNTLELADDVSLAQNSLAIAAINQKIAALKPIPFASAIDYKNLFSYWKYFLGLIVLLILILLLYPRAIVDGATRIVRHNEYFEKPAPFIFISDNDSLSITKGEDFTIKMHIEGAYVPERVECNIAGNMFLMTKTSPTSFEYIIRGCNASLNFFFTAEESTSQEYTLQVYPLPQLIQFSITAQVPSYTGLENFSVTNTGDISFPVGTQLVWNVDATDVDSLFFVPENSKKQPFNITNSQFILRHQAYTTTTYSLLGKNEFLDSVHIIDYMYTVIPDVRPTIHVEQKQDSTQYFMHYFKGEIQDDYGFSSLDFVYYINNDENTIVRVPLDFSPQIVRQEFFFLFDFSQFSQGDIISYYFEVYDNDAVNGRKSARSSQYDYSVPSRYEIEKIQEEYTKNIEASFDQSSTLAQDLMHDFDELKQKLLNENLSDWERKQTLTEMQEKQKQMQQHIDELTRSLQQKNDMKHKLSEQDEQILQKQKEIEELLQSLMDDELQKLMDEFNQMMDDFKKDEFINKSDDMKMSVEELSKQLDRDLELLKRMEVEEKIAQTSDRLEELGEKQQQLAEELSNNRNEQVNERQRALLNEMESIRKDYEDVQKKNESLQQKYDLQNFQQQFDQIQNDMNQAYDEQEQKQTNKAVKSMKKAAEQAQQLSKDMAQMMQQQMVAQNMEDMANLRQILENLVTFSFNQEALMLTTSKLSYHDPKYAETAEKQNILKENFAMIKDSLYALSLRVPQISQPINDEILQIYRNSRSALRYLEQNQRSLAKINQQYIMTSSNNLALLLSEVLSSMQQQAAQQMDGLQQCQNPKNSGKGQKPSYSQMQQMQQSLKEQMQQIIQQMKSGAMQSQQGKKQLSDMLMKEQMLKQMAGQMMKDGDLSPEGVQQLKEIQRMMDQTERDIVNQNITQQSIRRQEQILTRMLEAEKAQKERDLDKERESKSAQEKPSEKARKMFSPAEYEHHMYEDVLQQNTVKLKPHYMRIYEEYILNLNNGEK